MRIIRLTPFKRDYKSLPIEIQKKVDSQLKLLLSNPRHPSLRVKKLAGIKRIWYARVTRDYRMTFQIEEDTYILRRVGVHDILEEE